MDPFPILRPPSFGQNSLPPGLTPLSPPILPHSRGRGTLFSRIACSRLVGSFLISFQTYYAPLAPLPSRSSRPPAPLPLPASLPLSSPHERGGPLRSRSVSRAKPRFEAATSASLRPGATRGARRSLGSWRRSGLLRVSRSQRRGASRPRLSSARGPDGPAPPYPRGGAERRDGRWRSRSPASVLAQTRVPLPWAAVAEVGAAGRWRRSRARGTLGGARRRRRRRTTSGARTWTARHSRARGPPSARHLHAPLPHGPLPRPAPARLSEPDARGQDGPQTPRPTELLPPSCGEPLAST